MHRLRCVLAVLITVGIVIACAMLPTIVAKMHDNVQQDEITYCEVDAVKLEVKKLSMKEKLYLFCYGNTVDISTEKTNLNEYEIRELVMKQLKPYIKNGMISNSLSDFEITCKPSAHYEVGNLDMNNIFWEVYIYSVGSEYYESWIHIDDDTGKIISIGYECEGIDNVTSEMLVNFVNTYLDNINADEEVSLLPDSYFENEYDVNGEEINAVFDMEGLLYGELIVDFFISSNSFYTWIS